MTAAAEIAQGKILAAIEEFRNEKGYSPTVRELGVLTKMGTSTAQYHLTQLELQGKITRDRVLPRTIVVVP